MNTQAKADAAAQNMARWCGNATEGLFAISGCPPTSWSEVLAEQLPQPSPVTLVNVGANKGWAAAEFFGRWSQRPPKWLQKWRDVIVDYGVKNSKNTLKTMPFGQCTREMEHAAQNPAARHSRRGARVHMLELNPTNCALLRHIVSALGLEEKAHIHCFPASNASQTIYYEPGVPGHEKSSIHITKKFRACIKRKACASSTTVTLDDLFAQQGLSSAYQVTIDAEGADALVLEGMQGLLRRKAVRLLEFEYVRGRGFWSRRERERRDLDSVLIKLQQFGYECFWQSAMGPPLRGELSQAALTPRLVPASPPCWQPAMAQTWWSNLVCAHEEAALTVLRRYVS